MGISKAPTVAEVVAPFCHWLSSAQRSNLRAWLVCMGPVARNNCPRGERKLSGFASRPLATQHTLAEGRRVGLAFTEAESRCPRRASPGGLGQPQTGQGDAFAGPRNLSPENCAAPRRCSKALPLPHCSATVGPLDGREHAQLHHRATEDPHLLRSGLFSSSLSTDENGKEQKKLQSHPFQHGQRAFLPSSH